MMLLFAKTTTKDSSVWERPISYQLVGEVMAHQGDDGYRD